MTDAMWLEYYNLLEQPFGVTPDTRFLYLNQMYREALSSLWYSLQQGRGFMALVAPPGMGKTTLLFQLLHRLRSADARTVFLFQTCCDSSDLMRYLLLDLGIWPAADLATMHYQLNEALVREARRGKPFVFVIDEAQNLSEAVLERVRLLSDFETPQGKLLQIILAGQPQLISTLMQPQMLQFTQRISTTIFLDPLKADDVAQYIGHRLGMAGYQGKPLFTAEALQLIAQESRGIPRNINNICFGALSTGFVLGQKRIDLKIVEEVAADQSLRSLERRTISSLAERLPAQPAGIQVFRPKSVPGPTFRQRLASAWLGRSVRHTAYVVIVVLVLTKGVAISARPAPRNLGPRETGRPRLSNASIVHAPNAYQAFPSRFTMRTGRQQL